MRETKEETAIDVEVDTIVGIYTNPNHVMEYTDGEVRQQFSVCFRARPIDGTETPSDEGSEVQWINRLETGPVKNSSVHAT